MKSKFGYILVGIDLTMALLGALTHQMFILVIGFIAALVVWNAANTLRLIEEDQLLIAYELLREEIKNDGEKR